MAALIVVAAYLLLSGAHPPARRAAITAGVAFLRDPRGSARGQPPLAGDGGADHPGDRARGRRLARLRNVVLRHRVADRSFRNMAAAREAPVGLSWPLSLLQKSRDWLIAMSAVSFVAGMATGPFAIQHFNRVANYGVFANLSADLLASAVLMPALGLCLICQGLGIDHAVATPAYWLAGWSARGVITLGHLFATAPWAVMTASSAPEAALVISYLGIVFACLWRGPIRWVGLPMAAAVLVWPRPPAPVAWIAADGDDAAIVIGLLEVPLKPGARQYATQLWAQRRGFSLSSTLDAAIAEQSRAFDCDRKGCAANGFDRPALSAWWSRRPPSAARFEALCAHADILILRADVAPPPSCAKGIVIGAASFSRGGAAEVFGTPGHWRITWAQPLRGERPWTLSGNAG